jgi:hypothetical protein
MKNMSKESQMIDDLFEIDRKMKSNTVIENDNMQSLKEHCQEFNHNDVYDAVYFECEVNGIWVANWDYRMNENENTIIYIIVYNDYEIHTLIKKY